MILYNRFNAYLRALNPISVTLDIIAEFFLKKKVPCVAKSTDVDFLHAKFQVPRSFIARLLNSVEGDSHLCRLLFTLHRHPHHIINAKPMKLSYEIPNKLIHDYGDKPFWTY